MHSDDRASSRKATDRISGRRAGFASVSWITLSTTLWLATCGMDACGQTKKSQAKPKPKAEAKAEDLLSAGAFPKRWRHVSSDKKTALSATWKFDGKLRIPELSCVGMPPGYVRTAEKFTNFDLTLEWQYPKDEDCNSGILVHCGDDKVWPVSVQVQLHRPFVGSIFPSPGAKTASVATVKGLKLEVGKWHKCRVLSMNGTITVWINDKQVGMVMGCSPSSGYIGLQSEGFAINFRRFEIKRLPGPKDVGPKAAKKVPPPKVGKSNVAFENGTLCVTACRDECVTRRMEFRRCRPCPVTVVRRRNARSNCRPVSMKAVECETRRSTCCDASSWLVRRSHQ